MTANHYHDLLCSRLATAYPNQAKNLTRSPIVIRIDDRDSDDIYSGFCDIYLEIVDSHAGRFALVLSNVPFDDNVKSVVAELDGIWESTRTLERLTLNLSASQKADIRRLAATIRKVVGRGRRYLDPNWKWVAPRTAKSLENFARLLPSLGKLKVSSMGQK